MVTRAPRWVRELHMITGTWLPLSRNLRSATTPSITGISTSSTIKSGRRLGTIPRADLPSAAVPTTSRAESDETTERSRLRMTAESSTMRTRLRGAADISTFHQSEDRQLFAQRFTIEGLHQVLINAGF